MTAITNPDEESGGSFRPLAIPAFRNFWLASMVSNFGTMMQTVAAAWLMATIASGPQMVALVQTAATLPMMFFSIVAGALADIVDRRRLMLIAQIGMTAVALCLSAATVAGWTTPPLLLLATFLIALGTTLYSPAWQASVVEQVSPKLLDSATSLNSVGFNIARSLGPAIGGALVAALGSGPVFALNALSNVGIIAAIIAWRRPRPQPILPPESIVAAVGAGLRYAWLSPVVLTLLVRSAAYGFCGSCVWALTPVLARDALGGGPLTLGLLLGGFGCGAIVGAVLRAKLRISRHALLRECIITFGVGTVALGGSHWVPLSVLLMVPVGGAWVMALTSLSVSAQIIVPRWVVGRIIAINQMAVFAGMATGSLLWGLAARSEGIRFTFIAAGLLMLATLILDRRFALSREQDPDLSPARTEPFDPLQGPIAPTDGPIAIMIDYRVRPEDFRAFAVAMEDLGRIRRRDGARRWSLQQDMDDPERWVERFHSANWLDHLRRQTRPTVADQIVRQRVEALHDGQHVVRRTVERSRGAPPIGAVEYTPDY